MYEDGMKYAFREKGTLPVMVFVITQWEREGNIDEFSWGESKRFFIPGQ